MAERAQGPGVTLSAPEGLALYQANAWPDAAQAMAQALARAVGAPAPEPGRVSVGPRGALARCGPLAWWVIDGRDPAPPGDLGTCVELSAAWAPLTARGAQAAALLSRLTAIDLRDTAFPPGAFAMTGTAHVALALRRLDAQSYALYAPRSFRDDVLDLLMLHGRQFGASAP